jgi:hypothetical protein
MQLSKYLELSRIMSKKIFSNKFSGKISLTECLEKLFACAVVVGKGTFGIHLTNLGRGLKWHESFAIQNFEKPENLVGSAMFRQSMSLQQLKM